ncbi:MAG: hypothetical protein A3F83_03080 [Candidatus Glassbacteria bacterium RIFCSPLOWO2_12_FULL_58_11]|uniref:Oxidoreductase n=2 Tax=Candidatus Glassiibacteriota TaxID=1817805 RepID=A0A1F5YWR8_9BACT|nr:MAG: hypothetical protein A2Z86_04775 [Candidatus Glassbacteria bacterium GWA2_58_10]OGG04576.1 MAG: hypothetical protein A3F83_03080 [Candidatus Glassbacteria bacterium RIFCSPLOWO2_12_FULL_58_11]
MSLGVLIVAPGWVAGEHIRAFSANPRTHVAAIAAFTEGERLRAAEYCRKYGFECRVTEDYTDALKMAEVQIVSVCSINCFHYPHALAALDATKHVLVEKPLGVTPEEVAGLCAAARKSELVTMAGHIVRYYPAIRSLKGLIERGALGEPYHVESDYWHQLSGGWKTRRATAGGAMAMGGIHALDLVRHLIGEERKVESVSAIHSGPFRRKDFDYPPNVSALIRFEGGATGRVGVSVEAEMPYVFHLQVNGTKGAIRQKGVYSPELYPGAKDFVSLPESYPDDWNVAGHPFGAEIDDFVEAVCSGRPGQLDFAHARKTYDLLFAIERAAAQNSTVALSRGRGDFCMPY